MRNIKTLFGNISYISKSRQDHFDKHGKAFEIASFPRHCIDIYIKVISCQEVYLHLEENFADQASAVSIFSILMNKDSLQFSRAFRVILKSVSLKVSSAVSVSSVIL